jgi:hypothetical protein
MNTSNENRSRIVLQAVAILSVVVGLNTVAAAHDASLEQKMRSCYEKHAQLMEKPSVNNLYDCYRVHSYLMSK